jgi:lysozyme
LARWVKAVDPKTHETRTVAGLVTRRAAEGKLWLSADKDKFVNTSGMPQAVTK